MQSDPKNHLRATGAVGNRSAQGINLHFAYQPKNPRNPITEARVARFTHCCSLPIASVTKEANHLYNMAGQLKNSLHAFLTYHSPLLVNCHAPVRIKHQTIQYRAFACQKIDHCSRHKIFNWESAGRAARNFVQSNGLI
jgi:hypothetical protein